MRCRASSRCVLADTRPYTVLGQSYTPMTRLTPYKERGIASWYGKRYHDQKTSSGEIYDMYAMTAAHTVLPMPSYARVTNLANDKSVVVRINDRGPFRSDRLIDLSYTAAQHLGLLGRGSGLVEVEAIVPGAAPRGSEAAVAARDPRLARPAGGPLPAARTAAGGAGACVPAPLPAHRSVSAEQGRSTCSWAPSLRPRMRTVSCAGCASTWAGWPIR